MRSFFLYFFVCTLTLSACNKSANDINIYKEWEFENSVGGFTGFDTIKPSPDSTVSLTFKTDMTYETRLNKRLVGQGKFRIETIDNGEILQIENFEGVQGLWLENDGSVIHIENNKLHLMDYLVSEPYTHNFK